MPNNIVHYCHYFHVFFFFCYVLLLLLLYNVLSNLLYSGDSHVSTPECLNDCLLDICCYVIETYLQKSSSAYNGRTV